MATNKNASMHYEIGMIIEDRFGTEWECAANGEPCTNCEQEPAAYFAIGYADAMCRTCWEHDDPSCDECARSHGPHYSGPCEH